MGPVVEETRKQEIETTEVQEEYTPYQPAKGYGWGKALPEKQGLYDPSLEKDACGVGFAAYDHFLLSRGRLCADDRLAISRASQATKSSAMVSLALAPCQFGHD